MINRIHKHNFNSTKKDVTSRVDIKYKFLDIFYHNIQHESVFSIFQCVKILNYGVYKIERLF